MNYKEESDGVLVQRCQSGDQTAYTALVKRWHLKFCHKAYWIVQDADLAKDIAQDCWKVIFTKMKVLQNPESFAGWAMKIVHRKSIDAKRKDSKEQLDFDEYKNLKYGSSNIIEDEVGYDRRKQLLNEIKNLPTKQQLVLNLFYLEEYSIRDISETLDVSVGTIKSRLFHARERLKNKLK